MSNLDRLYERARAYGVSADELLGEMLAAERDRVSQALDEGEAAIASGRVISHDELFARLRKRHAERVERDNG